MSLKQWGSRTSTAAVPAVGPTLSQPSATPSISQPPTESTELNCGRATELTAAQWWSGTSTAAVPAVIPTISAVIPTISQPSATPSISEPTTESTELNCGRAAPWERNCGRATELPPATRWVRHRLTVKERVVKKSRILETLQCECPRTVVPGIPA